MPARYVTDLLDAFAAHGSAPALYRRGAEPATFRDLLADTYRSARALRRRGLARGDGLVLAAGNVPEALTVRLAAHLSGLRFTHLPPGPQVGHVLTDAAPALSLDTADLAALAAEARTESADPLPVLAEEGDIARISYTGGTTGLPKGVPITYAALHAAARAALRGAEATSAALAGRTARFLAVTPIAHVSGDIALIMLAMGVAVDVAEFEPGAMLRAIAAARGEAVLTYLYPALIYRLLDHPDLAGTDTGALAFVIYGSAPIAPARLRAAIERFGPVFQQGYASTEAPAITALTVADHVAGLDGRPELLASAGRALPGVRVDIRDRVGDVGEVWVQAASNMPGYWNRPAETAEVLRDGWVRTGDLGRLDADGYLYLVGRSKDMIIVGGHNCYATPIEAVLAEHPAVRAAAVVGIPDPATGEAIAAYLVATDPVDPDELRSLVTQRLGAINAPARIEYLDALPLTPLGKPDKRSLRTAASRITAG